MKTKGRFSYCVKYDILELEKKGAELTKEVFLKFYTEVTKYIDYLEDKIEEELDKLSSIKNNKKRKSALEFRVSPSISKLTPSIPKSIPPIKESNKKNGKDISDISDLMQISIPAPYRGTC